jgi:hypothetical protein
MFIEFTPDIFLHEAPIRFYGVLVQTRMTVVRLGSGELLLHSPTRLDDETRRELDRIGPVSFVVSPNKIHHKAIGDYLDAYPGARVFASPGLPERRTDLEFHGVLGDEPEPAWARDLDQAVTQGNSFFSEVVFLHRKSGTLIVADLVENLVPESLSSVGWMLARLMRIHGRPMASPEFRAYTNDPEAARRVFTRIQSWEFDRIVLAHGELIREGGREVLGRVCEHLLAESTARPAWRRSFYDLIARVQ